MTNLRTYKITSKSPNSSWIRFELDGYVSYSNGSEKYIYCKNTSPFYNYEVGNYLEIDLDRTRYRSSTEDVDSTSIAGRWLFYQWR